MSDLLPALRALASFSTLAELPPCDLDELGPVLVAHGLAPLASWHCEQTRLGAGLPDRFRESLLGHYTGTVNDNVMRLVTLRNALKDVPEVPVVLLDGAAYPGARTANAARRICNCLSAWRATSSGVTRHLISGFRPRVPVPEQGASTRMRSNTG